MDKSEIHLHNELTKRQLKGLTNSGMVNFECADCGKPLLCIQVVSAKNNTLNNVVSKIVVKCGMCNGYSVVKQVVGQFYPGVPEDNMSFDVFSAEEDTPESDIVFKAWEKQ